MPGTDKNTLQQNNSEHKQESPNDAESLYRAHTQAEKAIKKTLTWIKSLIPVQVLMRKKLHGLKAENKKSIY